MTTISLGKDRKASNGHAPESSKLNIKITAPQMRTAVFEIVGTAPLVVHRIDKKVEEGFQSISEKPTACDGMASTPPEFGSL